VFVNLELLVRDAFHLWRMEIHEAMAEVVDAVVIDGQKIPWFVLQDPGGGVMDGTVFGKNFCERSKALVFFLIDFGSARNPRQNGGLLHFLYVHTKSGESFSQAFRMDRTGRERPLFFKWGDHVREKIGDADSVDGLGGMPGKPAENMR